MNRSIISWQQGSLAVELMLTEETFQSARAPIGAAEAAAAAAEIHLHRAPSTPRFELQTPQRIENRRSAAEPQPKRSAAYSRTSRSALRMGRCFRFDLARRYKCSALRFTEPRSGKLRGSRRFGQILIEYNSALRSESIVLTRPASFGDAREWTSTKPGKIASGSRRRRDQSFPICCSTQL